MPSTHFRHFSMCMHMQCTLCLWPPKACHVPMGQGLLRWGCVATRCMLHTTHVPAPALPLCSFTTGGEEGYVRMHHFDLDYFSTKFF